MWYSIDAPGRPTIYPIKGEVVEIERGPDRTEVVVRANLLCPHLNCVLRRSFSLARARLIRSVLLFSLSSHT